MLVVCVVVLGVACRAPAVVPPVTTRDDGGACPVGVQVLAGEAQNARDLGGIPTAGGSVACGQVYRSAALWSLSTDGCEAFAALGVKTVLDLRVPSERQAVPDAACVAATARVVLAPMPIPYNVSPADYVADLNADATVKLIFETLGDEASYPVLFHCTYGRDRSGVVAALVLLALGASREEVVADYQRTAANGLSVFPASLAAVLDAVEQRGGIEKHLAAIGVSAEALAVLRAKGVARAAP
jgi:protein tyrosine phosphatase (PTP) superfamily phosphohydrolase (DUF442 family)